MSADQAHAPASPSGAARTVACTANLVMQRQYPDEEGPEAREGTAAHWLAANWPQPVGSTAPNGVAVDDDMIEAVQTYRDDIQGFMSLANVTVLHDLVEYRVAAPSVHVDSWGTLDKALVCQNVRGQYIVVIWDFKYGHGFVDAFENWQLINYAAGLIDTYGLPDDTLFILRIVQPRCYGHGSPVREWRVTARELQPYIRHLNAATHEALGNDPRATPNPLCKDCRARHGCEALQRSALSALEQSTAGVPVDLPAAAAGHELRRLEWAAKLLEARITGLQGQVEAALKGGEVVPGWSIEQGYGRERWTKPIAEVIALGSLYGKELAKPAEAITPNQARKLGIDEEVIKSYSETPRGELKLKAVELTKTRQIFGG